MGFPDGIRMVGPLGFLACDWGKIVHTPDDIEPCTEMATKRVMLYGGPQQRLVQLCPMHTSIVMEESTPRPDDQIQDEDR